MDPAGESVSLSRPQTWNRYVYSYNNPLSYVDPDGRAPKDIVIQGHTLHIDVTEINDRGGFHVDVANRKGARVGKLKGFFDVLRGQVPKGVMQGLRDAYDSGALDAGWMRYMSKWAKVVGPIALVLDVAFPDQANAAEDRAAIGRAERIASGLFGKSLSQLTAAEANRVLAEMQKPLADKDVCLGEDAKCSGGVDGGVDK